MKSILNAAPPGSEFLGPPAPRARVGSTPPWATKSVVFIAAGILSAAVGMALTRFPTSLVIGAVVALVGTVVVLMRPFLGLLAYTIIFVLRPGELYPSLAGLHLERMMGSLALVALFIGQVRTDGRISLDGSRQTRLLLLFVACALFSVPFASWRALAVEGIFDMIRILGFYIMVVYLVSTRVRLKVFVHLYCLLVLYLAFVSLYNYFAGHAAFAQGIDRAVGSTDAGGNSNTLGTTMACSLPLFLLLALDSSVGRTRILYALGCLPITVNMVLTGSRASFLGFLAGLAVLWWHSRRRLLLGVVGVTLLVAGFFVLPDQYQGRYSTIVQGDLDGSSRARLRAWVTGLEMAVERPLTGVGIKCFGAANGARTGSWLSSHSLYIQLLAETGFVGSTVFLLFLFELLRSNRRTRRGLGQGESQQLDKDRRFARCVLNGTLAGFCVLLVSGIFGHSLLRRTWYLYAALDLAILRLYLDEIRTATGAPARPEVAGPLSRPPTLAPGTAGATHARGDALVT